MDQPEATPKTSTGALPAEAQGGQPKTAQRESTGAAPAGPSGPPPPQGGFDNMLILLVAMGVIFYFLLIRPESKRKKEKEALLSSLKPKDKVVTIGGLHGTVVDVDGDEVVLLVDPKKDVKLRFRRSSVDMVEAAEEKEKK